MKVKEYVLTIVVDEDGDELLHYLNDMIVLKLKQDLD